MRQAILAFALLGVCFTAPAAADPLESRPDELRQCINDGGVEREALAQCLGAQAMPCIESEGGGTMAEALCWNAEAETWRAAIDEATIALASRAAYRDPARLSAANNAWFAWAEAECDYLSWEEGGGSGEQVDRVRCAAGLHAERAIALRLAAAAD
ncbi:MAG: DUF1311 domain-containing protein [Caulobacterales bacterium]|nr:DUF1311 domain-containing protein [Caulobacterales bacterium]